MKTQILGSSSLAVTRIAYGCMPLGGAWDAPSIEDTTRQKAVTAIRTALDAGINFFDHADIYSRGKSEEVFSDIWHEVPSLRQCILLQSKCGIRFENDVTGGAPFRYDFSYEHIIEAVNGSLRRLKTDYLDVLLLHRPDPLVEPEEVARAFDALHQAGKVLWFGVSNETAAQLELLRHFIRQPIVTNQVAFNIIHTHMLDEGILFNQYNPRLTRNAGTIEYCRLHDITLQAWGALAWGQLTGRSNGKPSEAVIHTSELVYEMAQQKGVSPEAIVVAWILRHPAKVQAIIGTTQPKRITAACQADTIEFSREEWYKLFVSGRGENLP